MGLFAIRKLTSALAELIGCEEDLAASSTTGSKYTTAEKGWAEVGESAGKMESWKEEGLEKAELVEKEFFDVFMEEYKRLMRLVSDDAFQLSHCVTHFGRYPAAIGIPHE